MIWMHVLVILDKVDEMDVQKETPEQIEDRFLHGIEHVLAVIKHYAEEHMRDRKD